MNKLAILSTHPIQYNVPLFRMLHKTEKIQLHIFYSKTWEQVKFDPDFQQEVVWDIPLSGGYLHSTFDASSTSGKKELATAIQAFAPKALIVYGWNFPGHLAMMRKFHGIIPVWFRGDSHLLDPMPFWKKTIRKLVLSWVYSHVDLAFSVGSANARYLDWCGLSHHRQRRAPHAVDNAFFSNNARQLSSDAEAWKNNLGILPEDKIILFAGKLELKKQPSLLIEAWQGLPNPKPHLLIAGSGPLESTLKADWKHESLIHFLGFQNQSKMPVLYRMANVFCLPSAGPGETWGLAANEALASGTPCLVSNRTGCGEDLFADPVHGRVLSWNDSKAWTLSISELLQRTSSAFDTITFTAEYNHQRFVDVIKKEIESLDIT